MREKERKNRYDERKKDRKKDRKKGRKKERKKRKKGEKRKKRRKNEKRKEGGEVRHVETESNNGTEVQHSRDSNILPLSQILKLQSE